MYVCECGKEFDNPQSFNGHKGHCKEHQLAKYDQAHINNVLMSRIEASKKCHNTIKTNTNLKALNSLNEWISEQHVCEHCGKVMTEKFGSGRFCSRACANARVHSEESKMKTSQTLKNQCVKVESDKVYTHLVKLENILKYNESPNYCAVCGNILDYLHRRNKTCSDSCKRVYLSELGKLNPNAGGLRSGAGTGKKGYYKGFYCDSTYELVFVIYNLDHNIKFERCKKSVSYEYVYKNKKHRYYPDFMLEDGSLVEIKGYHTELVDIKISAVNDRKISILYEKDLQYAFDYVKKNYNYKNLSDLYD